MPQKKDTLYRSKGNLADRYAVSARTIDRWREEGKFPPPDLVLPSGSPRWSDATIEAHERALVGKPAT
jgi:predicted DNA-binding transcriptional regulator AlpA